MRLDLGKTEDIIKDKGGSREVLGRDEKAVTAVVRNSDWVDRRISSGYDSAAENIHADENGCRNKI